MAKRGYKKVNRLSVTEAEMALEALTCLKVLHDSKKLERASVRSGGSHEVEGCEFIYVSACFEEDGVELVVEDIHKTTVYEAHSFTIEDCIERIARQLDDAKLLAARAEVATTVNNG